MMADLIDRQAAIDAILHNQEVYSNNFGNDPIDKYTIAIIDNDAQTIAQLPSADVVEVVRCKECKHWHREIHNGIEYFNYNSCDLNHGGDGHDFYCTDGEEVK